MRSNLGLMADFGGVAFVHPAGIVVYGEDCEGLFR